jgi:drug/metabolite transporter (DMT)-like permease
VLTYVGWLFILSLPPVALTAWLRRRNRLLALARQEAGWAALAAVFGILTYTLAMFAYSIAPVAPMAALRETSIVFGAILGALVLKESFGLRRITLAILLVAGLVLIQTSHS